ncbi:hypothetical protein OG613_42520 [Streptomyces sp. NBC_00015]|uniref:hypothetical protein n=1 Tax=Streptomyces sp. NBC_00015 TaxID=2903611 RepID=UPI0032448829
MPDPSTNPRPAPSAQTSRCGIDASFLRAGPAEVGVAGGVRHAPPELPAVQIAHLGLDEQRLVEAEVRSWAIGGRTMVEVIGSR